MTTMTTALDITKFNIKAQQKNLNVAKTTILAGQPGIGKTERMRDLASDLNMHFLHISAPEVSPEHLSGIPEFQEAKGFEAYHVNGVNAKATYWSVPEIIYNANTFAQDSTKDGVVLMLDDIHEAPIATIAYFYQLFNEKKLSNFNLDKKVFIVGAMNNSTEAGFDGLPSPVKNRISLINVSFDKDEWLENYSDRLHFHIRSFLKAYSDFLSEPETTEIEQFGTPRSWTNLAESYSFISEEDYSFATNNVFDLAKGNVSNAAATALEKHIQYIEKLNLKNIVSNKEIFDINKKKDPLDQVLMGYIVNFIETIEDAQYLADVITKNIDNRTFIGFVGAELYTKYDLADRNLGSLTNGLSFFLDYLLLEDNEEININNYGKLSAKDKKTIKNFSLSEDSKNTILDITSVFSGGES